MNRIETLMNMKKETLNVYELQVSSSNCMQRKCLLSFIYCKIDDTVSYLVFRFYANINLLFKSTSGSFISDVVQVL